MTDPAFNQYFAHETDRVFDEKLVEEMYWSSIARNELLILNQGQNLETGSDGVTSSGGTFNSAGSTFETNGVGMSVTLVITSGSDAGSYSVKKVISETSLSIDGSFSNQPEATLDFEIRSLNLYGEPVVEPSYVAVSPQIPIHIKLDPEVEELEKYGYDRKREAIIWFAAKILRDRSISVKVGDRVNFTFVNEIGATVVEQFEIHEISPVDFARQSKNHYHVSAAADRTHKAKRTG